MLLLELRDSLPRLVSHLDIGTGRRSDAAEDGFVDRWCSRHRVDGGIPDQPGPTFVEGVHLREHVMPATLRCGLPVLRAMVSQLAPDDRSVLPHVFTLCEPLREVREILKVRMDRIGPAQIYREREVDSRVRQRQAMCRRDVGVNEVTLVNVDAVARDDRSGLLAVVGRDQLPACLLPGRAFERLVAEVAKLSLQDDPARREGRDFARVAVVDPRGIADHDPRDVFDVAVFRFLGAPAATMAAMRSSFGFGGSSAATAAGTKRSSPIVSSHLAVTRACSGPMAGFLSLTADVGLAPRSPNDESLVANGQL